MPPGQNAPQKKMPPGKNSSYKECLLDIVTRKKWLLRKKVQLVNMLHMKPITYNIKNMLISDIYSQNQNIQYREVQITNIFLKGYPFSCTLEQFKSRIYGCEVS